VAFDGVPWAVTGSQLDTFVMREFANFATRDSEGIQLPGHGKVTASGTNVSIAAGGLVIRNKQAGGQSYVGRIASDTLVPIPPAGAGGASHLIVATVKDPDFSPWQPWPGGTPANTILFGPYFYPERLTATSTTTKASQLVSYSAYALARVDMPANTSTVLPGYITDLRSLAQPRTGFAAALMAGPASQDSLLVTDTTYRTFPNNGVIGVTIPEWATNCVASISYNQVQASGAGDFQARINLGGLFGDVINFDYNGALQTAVPGAVEGIPFNLFGDIDVRSLQGQTVTCFPQAKRTFTSNTGTLWFISTQQLRFDLRFVERAV
jgi:hypothetical protein